LTHVTNTLQAMERGAPVDLVFQSIAGTELANRSFGVNLSTGFFNGSVMDTVTFDWHPYKGVVVQNANIGTGYFTAGYLSGEVWLQGN